MVKKNVEINMLIEDVDKQSLSDFDDQLLKLYENTGKDPMKKQKQKEEILIVINERNKFIEKNLMTKCYYIGFEDGEDKKK